MPVTHDSQGFPLLGADFVDDRRKITPAWRQFLVSLWERSGGSSGGTATFDVGDLKATASATVPTGWLFCDGSAVSRTTYDALFGAIGTTWGIGDGVTTFNIPNLSDRALVGISGTKLLGAYGGAATVALGTANLPAHSHAVTDPGHTHTFTGASHGHGVTDPGHNHSQIQGPVVDVDPGAGYGVLGAGTDPTGSSNTGVTVNNTTAGGTNANASTGISTQNTGSGTAVAIQNPYAAVKYLIKT